MKMKKKLVVSTEEQCIILGAAGILEKMLKIAGANGCTSLQHNLETTLDALSETFQNSSLEFDK